MIFGNIAHQKTYGTLPAEILACFQYVKDHDLMARSKGGYKIAGDAFFVNIVEYETCERADRFWEAHRQYIDVHIMLEGRERIDVNFIENMQQKPFVAKDDFLPLDGEQTGYVDLLHRGDFLICYPEDGHRTAVCIGAKAMIKKAIFKVQIK